MKYNMYSMYDKVGEDYSFPFCAKHDADMKRGLARSIPKDFNLDEYDLYAVGEFDIVSGQVKPLEKRVVSLSGLLEAKSEGV